MNVIKYIDDRHCLKNTSISAWVILTQKCIVWKNQFIKIIREVRPIERNVLLPQIKDYSNWLQSYFNSLNLKKSELYFNSAITN